MKTPQNYYSKMWANFKAIFLSWEIFLKNEKFKDNKIASNSKT